MNDSEWYPAIIANKEHILKFHTIDGGRVSSMAGQRVRVRPSTEAQQEMEQKKLQSMGCHGRHLEVHPEDAERLWPDLVPEFKISICDCQILTD